MAMTPGQNYVSPDPNSPGNYVVVVNGQTQGSGMSLNDAQNTFNLLTGQSNAPSSSATPTAGSSDPSAMQNLMDAIATGDSQKFQEAIREFNLDFAEKQRQYNQSQAENQYQFNQDTALGAQKNYNDLATSLLDTAAKLSGPSDYFQFQQMTSQGRNLWDQLAGNQPRAAFSSPAGMISPITVGGIMQDLGFQKAPQLGSPITSNYQYFPSTPSGSSPSSGGPTSGAGVPVYDKGGKVPGKTGGHILAILQTGEKVVPVKGRDHVRDIEAVRSLARMLNIPIFDEGGIVGVPGVPGTSGAGTSKDTSPNSLPSAKPYNLPSSSPSSGNINNYTVPAGSTLPPETASPSGIGSPSITPSFSTSPSIPQVPLPYQINPAVWDAMGSVGQQLALSAAKAAGWDPNEYLRQINLARPQGSGTNPQDVLASYWTPSVGRAQMSSGSGVY